MAEEWTCHYDSIEDSYIPGKIMPPVKNEWRFRYYSYFWKVTITTITKSGEKAKNYAPLRSDSRPVIKGSTIGLSFDEGGDNPRWHFFEFSECEIAKFRVKTNYILVSDDDDGVKVKFRDDDPVQVPDTGEW